MTSKIFVTKYDGSRQAYSQEKVLGSILRSGVPKENALKVLTQVEAKLYDGISTKELYRLVHEEIGHQGLHPHSRFYRLREILAKMGPIDFEKFIKKILEKEGYKCQWNVIIQGFCIEHQIDVVAQKGNQLFLVEVKHHQNHHRDCGLGTVAELWARLNDIKDGFKKGRSKYDFSGAWLINNTKFSQHAKKYARCKGIKLTGWRYKGKEGLEKIIENLGREEVDRLIKTVIQT